MNLKDLKKKFKLVKRDPDKNETTEEVDLQTLLNE